MPRNHRFHAEAKLIEGYLELPLKHQIGPQTQSALPLPQQAHSSLPETGGYITQRLENFRVGEAISIRSGYTQVAGNRSTKPDEGWSTLVTYVLEGLNVLEVLTADRIVGQIITTHPYETGFVPRISFLGSRFENLRIAGHPVTLKHHHDILGPRPEDDGSYILAPGVKDAVSAQYKHILGSKNLPADAANHYKQLSADLGNPDRFECSLIDDASGDYPGSSHGHKIHVPEFGWITLGKVEILHEDFDKKSPKKTTVKLTMIDLLLGCAAHGPVTTGTGSGNGGTDG